MHKRSVLIFWTVAEVFGIDLLDRAIRPEFTIAFIFEIEGWILLRNPVHILYRLPGLLQRLSKRLTCKQVEQDRNDLLLGASVSKTYDQRRVETRCPPPD